MSNHAQNWLFNQALDQGVAALTTGIFQKSKFCAFVVENHEKIMFSLHFLVYLCKKMFFVIGLQNLQPAAQTAAEWTSHAAATAAEWTSQAASSSTGTPGRRSTIGIVQGKIWGEINYSFNLRLEVTPKTNRAKKCFLEMY